MPSERRTFFSVRRDRSPEDVTPEMIFLGVALGIVMASLALYLV